MKLRDFEFCVSNFDKENAVFNMQVRCLLAHFFHYYKNQDSVGVKKIVIELEPEGSGFYSGSEHPVPGFENLLGIATLRKEFNFESYFRLPQVEAQKYALSAFIDGIKDVCEIEGIEMHHFDEIASQIKNDGFVYQRYWKKRAITSPSKNKKANVFFKYLADRIEIYIEIHSGQDDPQLELIEEISPPYLFEFENAFGKLFWESNSILVFESKKGKQIKREV